MTSFLTKITRKKILGERLENNFSKEVSLLLSNTLYLKTLLTPSLKSLLAGVSEHDRKVLIKVKRRAHRLDIGLFTCCGIKLGWSSLIGLVPM